MHATSHPGGVGCRRIDLCNNNTSSNSNNNNNSSNNNNNKKNTDTIRNASDLSWHADLGKEWYDAKIGSKDQQKKLQTWTISERQGYLATLKPHTAREAQEP